MVDWSDVRALVLDSDGVLTDGGVFVSESGEQIRRFCIKDGAGLVRLREVGFHLAVISSSPCTCVIHRARQLGVTEVHVGVKDKCALLAGLLARWGIPATATVYVGDDMVDLAPMARVGFPCAVANAVDEVKAAARYVTRAAGGNGAVREIADLLLAARGRSGMVAPSL